MLHRTEKPKPAASGSPVRTAYMSVSYDYAQYTTQHRTVPITFSLMLQTIITAQMLSTGGEGSATRASTLSVNEVNDSMFLHTSNRSIKATKQLTYKQHVSLDATPSISKPCLRLTHEGRTDVSWLPSLCARKLHLASLWPWPLTSEIENLLSNAHSHGKYLCQVSLKSLY